MLKTIATVPAPHMIELLALIEQASQIDAEPRLLSYLRYCARTGYEPPLDLLNLARDAIARKPHKPAVYRPRRRVSDFLPLV